ncbi:hypothetical protein BOQ62_08825 [Chryseobacterium sp. CH21]|uniref:hypothetical protein n=1 Tax=Chryseobacterium sp. CH21 TaxID=713556 RepID=UPI00100A9430|nr:hypothetical protein [Chryseobacterium sp. CH21]RXM39948.1 hypothetical protein BOQ62_08825 [Chryseobacterium sp. CH21]
MENKCADINKLLQKLSQEELSGYEFVDYWDADTTALGLQKENIIIYISTFNYTNADSYYLVIEELETGNVLKLEDNRSYHELIEDIQPFLR